MSNKLPTDAFADLDLETCSRIQEFHDRLEERNLFDLLGVDPDAGLMELRRAYFRRSKQFHPDRFFSRKLGPYKGMLERIFQWCHAAFKFLKDVEQRELYKQRILRLSEPSRQRRPPSARIVPVERDSGLEFVISEEDSAPLPPQPPRRRQPQTVEGDSFEFFVDEAPAPQQEAQQAEEEDGLEFVIDE